MDDLEQAWARVTQEHSYLEKLLRRLAALCPQSGEGKDFDCLRCSRPTANLCLEQFRLDFGKFYYGFRAHVHSEDDLMTLAALGRRRSPWTAHRENHRTEHLAMLGDLDALLRHVQSKHRLDELCAVPEVLRNWLLAHQHTGADGQLASLIAEHLSDSQQD